MGKQQHRDVSSSSSSSDLLYTKDIKSCLQQRYGSGQIYTRLGSHHLVALNPHNTMALNDEDTSLEYVTNYKDTNPSRMDDPHLFELINHSYYHMRRTGNDQLVYLTGESGSGKTTLRHLVLKHLSRLATHKKESTIQTQILQSQAVLDAFGHFGYYGRHFFNERGRLVGAKIHTYCFDPTHISPLLCRLVTGADAQERQSLGLLSDPAHYRLLHGLMSSPSPDALQHLKSSLKQGGLRKEHITRIMQLLAVILHLGNLIMVEPSQGQEAAQVKNTDTLALVADMLGVDAQALQNVLTFKTTIIRNDVLTVILDADQAREQCNALINVLTSLLFSWLVARINQKTSPLSSCSSIGLLDFPAAAKLGGKTTQEAAGFHHFCLGLANERLQHFFHSQVAAVETVLTPCLELLMRPSKSLTSLLNTMTDSTLSGKRTFTDTHWMDSVIKYNGQHPALTLEKSSTGKRLFGVAHYTGSVTYDPDGFLHGNSNHHFSKMDFAALFSGSSCWNAFVVDLFSSDPSSSSVLGQTQAALDDLLADAIQQEPTTLWSVQCIQPNDQCDPTHFDTRRVQQQIDALGLATLVQHVKSSWPHSWSHDDFVQRYALVLQVHHPGMDSLASPHSWCNLVLDACEWTEQQARVDATKIFLSDEPWMILENQLRQIEKDQQRQQRDAAAATPTLSDSDHPSFYSEEDITPDDTTQGLDSSYYDTVPLDPVETKMPQTATSTTLHDTSSSVKRETSTQRKQWLFFVWLVTWWIPGPCLKWCGHMKRKDIQIAWREKVTLCFMIFLLCVFVMWFLIFFGDWVCPHQDVYSPSELQLHGYDAEDTKKTPAAAFVAIRGEVFDLTEFVPRHYPPSIIPTTALLDYAGKDITSLFPVQVSDLCEGATTPVSPLVSLDYHVNLTDKNAHYHDFRYSSGNYRPNWYYDQMTMLRRQYKKGNLGFEYKAIHDQATTATLVNGIKMTRNWAVLDKRVYDLSAYILGGRHSSGGDTQVDVNFMDDAIVNLFRTHSGTDITTEFNKLPLDPALRRRQLACLRNLFFVGMLDTRNSPQCQFSTYLLLIVTCLLASVILFKFLAALRIGGPRAPEDHDKFVICQITCYTEDEDSLRKTIDSIAKLTYDDKRKLMFIICDGMIVGGGNDRPTPRIVLDILKVAKTVVDPEPLAFVSVGEGRKQYNRGKVYSGLYEIGGHVVPYLVVVKCGHPDERQKPGNRGKRDSQLVLMQYLNRVHFDAAMNPLQLEIYHQMKNVIGVNPSFYDFVLMVDADTEVLPDGLNNLVSTAVHDSKIIGLCGETTLANEKDSWVTMIQVYEYFISHHMIKAFESLFSTVSCLPGCFTMYRIRTVDGKRALFVSNEVINDYSVNVVDTLHKKNLLHLGEDRYLTTLLLKHFANYKTKFTSDAQCRTVCPDVWSVLISQRRRWINSTIHNLGELMFLPRLCGFCCFSMRFVVVLDLISTLVMPALVGYLIYLIYSIATADADTVPYISIATIAGVYGLQALLFIIKRKWEYIIWMLVSVLAIPVFSFYIPLYSYWHFDDFSWGNTRVVMGDTGKAIQVVADEGDFDPSSIPTMTWAEYEKLVLVDNGGNDYHGVDDDGLSQLSSGVYSRGYHDMSDTLSMRYPSSPPSNMGLRTASGLFTMDGSMLLPSGGSMMMPPPSSASLTMVPSSTSLLLPGQQNRYSFASTHLNALEHQPPPVSDENIRYHVHSILSTADLTQVTKKQVREQLQLIFGTSMAGKKDYINACIESSLQDRMKPY